MSGWQRVILAARRWPRGVRLAVIVAVACGAFAVLCLQPRMPLGPGHHDFADKRAQASQVEIARHNSNSWRGTALLSEAPDAVAVAKTGRVSRAS